MVRSWGVLYILTWKCASRHNGVHFFDISTSKSGPRPPVFNTFDSKCASRHNGVQFFIAPVASWLRTRRFSEPTFRPSGATNHWKNTVFRDFPTFSRICIFCLLTLSLLIFSLLIFLFSLPLPCSAFHLSILSEVWLLNFLRSGFGKPRILCVNPGYLSKPYKNFGFVYVRYIYIYLSLSLSLSLSVCLSICLSVYLSVYVSTHLFLYLSWCLTICLCVHVSICLSRHLFL